MQVPVSGGGGVGRFVLVGGSAELFLSSQQWEGRK